MQDAWRAYLELALGVTEASRKKAEKVAKRLVGKGGATAAQVQALTDDLRSTGLANREAMTKLVRGEVERALSRVGLVSAEEVASLSARVRELESELREARARASVAEAAATAARSTAAPAGSGSDDTLANLTGPSTARIDAAPAGDGPADTAAVAKKAARKAVAKKAVKKALAKNAVAKAGGAAAADPAPLPTPGGQEPGPGGGPATGMPRRTAKKATAKKATAGKATKAGGTAKRTRKAVDGAPAGEP